MNKINNLEAARAKAAFDFAEKGNAKQKQNKEFNYSAAVQELPSMLRMNGLRATMAFYYSKEKAHRMVFSQIRNWFLEKEPTKMITGKFPENEEKKDEAKNFMKLLLELPDDDYRIVQAETLTIANWMIRFVKENNNSGKEKNQKMENDGTK